jgi:PLP dependent protein
LQASERQQVVARIARIRERIEQACRDAGRPVGAVTLIAVSKRQPDELVAAALAVGQRDFGENHVQALLVRRQRFADGARWHLIGPVQTNKAKFAVQAHCVHTVDRLRVADALAKHLDPAHRLDVLVQVNISGEASKSGVEPEQAEPLLLALQDRSQLDVRGLMCIPQPGHGRRGFAALRELRDQLRAATGMALPELSMGMSDDFAEAIGEGATMIRVGTAIFGPRSS